LFSPQFLLCRSETEVVWKVTTRRFIKSGFLFLTCPKRGKRSYTGKKMQAYREKYLLSFREFTRNKRMFAELKTQRKKKD